MITEKITKDGKIYNVWKVSEKAGFYLAEEIDTESESALERISDMTALCRELCEKINEKTVPDEKLPYLMRRSTGEKIVITQAIFKLGKDAARVDYVVDNNPTISRSHADLMRQKDGYYVKDKGSLNHTFVDGKKLEPEESVKLESGSLLQLSDEVFEFIEG